jgi:hypothetical protein
MSNQNRADISTFESLQNQAHMNMGMSEMGVFNEGAAVQNSSNTREIVKALRSMHRQVDSIKDVQNDIERVTGKRNTKPSDASFFDSLIERGAAVILGHQRSLRTAANNIAILADREKKRLNWDYVPGTPVSREGIDSATFAERKAFADAISVFYRGKLQDGTPYTAFLK